MKRPILFALVLLLASFAQAFNVDLVGVGNPGNTGKTYRYADDWGGGYVDYYNTDTDHGSVSYVYGMGTYEITTGQYVEFLNAVASTDTYGLYNIKMDNAYHNSQWNSNGDFRGCGIVRNGVAGSYSYSLNAAEHGGNADRPVNFVSWADAARFANWMHNGQPTGGQVGTTTETGSYDLTATQQYYSSGWITGNAPSLNSLRNLDGDDPYEPTADEIDAFWNLNGTLAGIERQEDASWVLPTFNEWYKAAYHADGQEVLHDDNALLDNYYDEYFDYPTSSNDQPAAVTSEDLPDTGTNSATYGDSEFGPHTPVGAHANSPSPYGTYDQGGNVREWTESIYTTYDGAEKKSVMGGTYISSGYQIKNTYNYAWMEPASEGHTTGFRLGYTGDLQALENDNSSIPEPMTVLAIGSAVAGLGGYLRRRKQA